MKDGKGVTLCAEDGEKYTEWASWSIENVVNCAWQYSWSTRILQSRIFSKGSGAFTRLLRPISQIIEPPMLSYIFLGPRMVRLIHCKPLRKRTYFDQSLVDMLSHFSVVCSLPLLLNRPVSVKQDTG
jgi:hypothetical protein